MKIIEFIKYLIDNQQQILSLLLEHIKLTVISVGLAILIGVPLGIFISYVKKLNKPILGISSIVQAIPSMALLGFMIPLLGIGSTPAIVTVVLYSLLPIIKNTYTGIDNINSQTLEAAKGIGLTKFQVLTKVQIPLALPVIMAGVRISAVTAVGLMTMAAFIGAGGLGYLVFSGIRTVNNFQILAGAIPACLLALLVDFIASMIESLVTPISLQKGGHTTNRNKRNGKKLVLSLVSLVLIASFILSYFTGAKKSDNVITIGSKDYTEQAILGNMVADLIEERTDISVNRQLELGGTQVCFSALNSGEIDMYVEYSGTAYGDMLKHEPISDVDKVYETVKADFKEKYGIETLKQMGFNNTYTLAITKETSEKYNLKTISDLAKVANQFVSGTTFEFLNRNDGLPGVEKKYGFKFKDSKALDSSPRYIALNNNDVDIIDAFSTDGLLKKYELVTLEDDLGFFPPYYAIPIISEDVLAKYPEIEPLMDELGTVLTNDVMVELNYKVDELQEKPDVVAHDFLIEQGLISN